MKIKCENILRCGNYNCVHNLTGYSCNHVVVALDENGKCALMRLEVNNKPAIITNVIKTT